MSQHSVLPTLTVTEPLAYPPRHSTFTQKFWTELQAGIWQTTCCDECGKKTFPPRPVCPHCWSTDISWEPLSAQGTLYSWTRIYAAPSVFAKEAPYAVGIVDLDEGIRVACRLMDTDEMGFLPGMRVEMVALNYEDGTLFAARPTSPNTTA